MIVCSHCLEAIESHEGNQIKRKLSWLNDEDLMLSDDYGRVRCEWCEEKDDLSDMYEI